ncbi:MAG: hypothetical protein R2828_17165 [Saprospiraceae bacterium]
MRAKKNFDYGKGKYYFTIKASPSNITIYRNEKGAAERTFLHYRAMGKDVEWHGKWDGKKFIEISQPAVGQPV